MAKKLEFFYDCSSPWTYLAFSRIEEVARRHGAELAWRPILVGGVFNAVNPSVYEGREHPVKPKVRYYDKDLQDWARLYGLKIGHPTVFPVNSVKAMRGAFVAHEHGKISPYSRGLFEAYWRRPGAYLEDHVRRAVSTWTRVGPGAEQRAVRSLRDDLDSGRWAERNSDLADLDAAELGLRLLVA